MVAQFARMIPAALSEALRIRVARMKDELDHRRAGNFSLSAALRMLSAPKDEPEERESEDETQPPSRAGERATASRRRRVRRILQGRRGPPSCCGA